MRCSQCRRKFENILITIFYRSSNYDRDRRPADDIKKRLDDYPPKREDSFAASKTFKAPRDDFKSSTRVVDIQRGSGGFSGSSSSRMESSSVIKDRFPDRNSGADSFHRGILPPRAPNDDRDARNGSSSKRYLEPQSESRFSDRATTWNSGSSHQSFNMGSSHGNSSDMWPPKQSAEPQSSGWRSNVDDRYSNERFSSSDRKPAIPQSQFLDSSASHTTMRGGNQGFMTTSLLTQSTSQRFSSNRYDNSRY